MLSNLSRFEVGSYVYLEDKEQDFIYTIRNGYKLIEKYFIPVMMDFTADYEPIPATLNGYATISLTFLLNADTQEIFDSQLLATEQLVSKLVGNHQTLTDGLKTYNSVWNMDALLPAGQTKPINGVYYTQISTNVYVDFSDTFYFGNSYKYYLDSKLLLLYDGDVARTNEENYPHKQGDYEAKGGLTTSQWSATLISYLDSNLQTICDSISSGTYDMEKVYTYAEYFNGTLKHTFPVKITAINRKILLGEKQYLSISLIKSDKSAT